MTAITSPVGLKDFALTTITFEEIKHLDGEVFGGGGFLSGGGVGGRQLPYPEFSFYLSREIVEANANLASSPGGVAIRTFGPIAEDGYLFLNWMSLIFSIPQRAVGFFYRDHLATKVRIEANSYSGSIDFLEAHTFPNGEGYAGLIRPNADIFGIVIESSHKTHDDAANSPLYIDDLSFARHKKGPHFGELVVYVTCGIAAGGGGVIIYPNGRIKPFPPPSPLDPELPQADVAANLLLQARGVKDPVIRAEIQRLALVLLTDSIAETFESE